MPSQFDTDFAAAAGADLLAYHGETITYTPKGGAARSIQAIIQRFPPATIPGTSQGYGPYIELQILNDATDGAETITRGGDCFTFPDREGSEAIEHKHFEIVSQDAGMWTLRFPVGN